MADHSSRGVVPSVFCLSADREDSTVRRPCPTGASYALEKQILGQYLGNL
jgi:hypothetical protein